ncbi:hypothetical protein F5B18DRAFT_36996 [Nemania serpens]|nr:hypothetical protein F5B18DRAFT_36996 [Nemania serpens]
MDGLYEDTFGTPLADDGLSNDPAASRNTEEILPENNDQLWRMFERPCNQRGNDDESSGIKKSPLELAVRNMTRAGGSLPSLRREMESSESCPALWGNISAEEAEAQDALLQMAREDEAKKVETVAGEPRIVDQRQSSCSSCAYDYDYDYEYDDYDYSQSSDGGHDGYQTNTAKRDDDLQSREGSDWDRRSSRNCCSCRCGCRGNLDDDAIVGIIIEKALRLLGRYILGLVKTGLASAANGATWAYRSLVRVLGFGQEQAEEDKQLGGEEWEEWHEVDEQWEEWEEEEVQWDEEGEQWDQEDDQWEEEDDEWEEEEIPWDQDELWEQKLKQWDEESAQWDEEDRQWEEEHRQRDEEVD